MTRFIIHRFLSSIPVLFGIITAVFILARVIPGDPCKAALGERATDAVCDQWVHAEGLDRPICDPVLQVPRQRLHRGLRRVVQPAAFGRRAS